MRGRTQKPLPTRGGAQAALHHPQKPAECRTAATAATAPAAPAPWDLVAASSCMHRPPPACIPARGPSNPPSHTAVAPTHAPAHASQSCCFYCVLMETFHQSIRKRLRKARWAPCASERGEKPSVRDSSEDQIYVKRLCINTAALKHHKVMHIWRGWSFSSDLGWRSDTSWPSLQIL